MQNLLYFFKIKNNSSIIKEEEKIDAKLIINIDPIIIEYINNNSNKIKWVRIKKCPIRVLS